MSSHDGASYDDRPAVRVDVVVETHPHFGVRERYTVQVGFHAHNGNEVQFSDREVDEVIARLMQVRSAGARAARKLRSTLNIPSTPL